MNEVKRQFLRSGRRNRKKQEREASVVSRFRSDRRSRILENDGGPWRQWRSCLLASRNHEALLTLSAHLLSIDCQDMQSTLVLLGI